MLGVRGSLFCDRTLVIFVAFFPRMFFCLFFCRPSNPQAALLKARRAPSAPVAAAAVLGQKGLWGSLMGGPDTTKVQPEETESTDGEDEVGENIPCQGYNLINEN